MSDKDNFYGKGDFFYEEELDENGNPKPPDENGRHEPPDDEEEGLEYPTPKPREKEPEGQMDYSEKSPELYKKRETLLQPNESLDLARSMYPNSPQLRGEPEDPLRNRVVVLHKISESEILNQPGYRSLREALQSCLSCKQLDFARLENEDLSGIGASELSFKNSLMVAVSFKDANIRGSDFSHAELEVDFDGADLKGSNFSHADLSQCSFKNADLTNCNMVSAVLPPPDQMKGAQMAGIRTEEEKLSAQREIFPT